MTAIISNSPDETINLGKQIALRLEQGSIVAVQGTLGSGKTYLSKGIALGLGIKENLTSPTYTIINEYTLSESDRIQGSFFHIDVYRLNNVKDFEDIGGMDIIYSNGISVIEWSDRIQELLPEHRIDISIEITGFSSRTINITGLETI